VDVWHRILKTRTIDENGCWLSSLKGGRGYSQIRDRGPSRSIRSAHRFSWERHFGKIPDGMLICHKCDVRNCFNPDHLFMGDHSDNAQDMWDKGRHPPPVKHFKNGNQNKTHCTAGHPYSGNNLRVNANGGRCCRLCERLRMRLKRGSKRFRMSRFNQIPFHGIAPHVL
jgi:hypothetical protein